MPLSSGLNCSKYGQAAGGRRSYCIFVASFHCSLEPCWFAPPSLRLRLPRIRFVFQAPITFGTPVRFRFPLGQFSTILSYIASYPPYNPP